MTNVKVVGGIVDGHGIGSQIEIDGKSALYLASIGYVEIIETQAVMGEKGESAPKKPATRKRSTKPKEE
ncbi:hypothetical protein [Bacillus gaemokensis]|uniref:Uncharacterized protein n=1 Tax=Bacillus gaemokensis TaxID=574375 RepID=A0A073K5C3_9BACI|nr:hypothetical protein [Bacillus gaemokensis]KEK22474.1 hypothetical protein BAGA_18885 [Bacillus gaemokensis]KYG28831.1 hypothetical protein AZF08_13990 [Bacillus gaemokensis]